MSKHFKVIPNAYLPLEVGTLIDIQEPWLLRTTNAAAITHPTVML